MATLISDDFSGTLSTNWNYGAGGYVAINSGQLTFTGEGFACHKTSCGTGDKWFRFRSSANDQIFLVIGADASGNLTAVQLVSGWTGYWGLCDGITHYTTYTTWGSDTDYSMVSDSEAFSAAQYWGITLDKAGKTLRVWGNVSAAAPTSVTSWDGGNAAASSTFTDAIPGDYVGFGSWTSTPGTLWIDDVTAGDFSESGGSFKAAWVPRLTNSLGTGAR